MSDFEYVTDSNVWNAGTSNGKLCVYQIPTLGMWKQVLGISVHTKILLGVLEPTLGTMCVPNFNAGNARTNVVKCVCVANV